jgi:hypothetical protein
MLSLTSIIDPSTAAIRSGRQYLSGSQTGPYLLSDDFRNTHILYQSPCMPGMMIQLPKPL